MAMFRVCQLETHIPITKMRPISQAFSFILSILCLSVDVLTVELFYKPRTRFRERIFHFLPFCNRCNKNVEEHMYKPDVC